MLYLIILGSVAERLKAAVLKTVVGLHLPEVRILSLPHIVISISIYIDRYNQSLEKWREQ